MSAVRLAGRVRRLTVAEWRVLGESAVAAIAVEAALRLVPLSRIVRAVERPAAPASPMRRDAAARVARLARWPSRLLPFPATCLRVALVQVAALRRHGAPAVVRFGVRRVGTGLEFHAWADCDGPIDDAGGAADYRIFEPVPPASVSRTVRWSPPAAP
jgi:hypothetical protein